MLLFSVLSDGNGALLINQRLTGRITFPNMLKIDKCGPPIIIYMPACCRRVPGDIGAFIMGATRAETQVHNDAGVNRQVPRIYSASRTHRYCGRFRTKEGDIRGLVKTILKIFTPNLVGPTALNGGFRLKNRPSWPTGAVLKGVS
jgi:hypothetical protein